MSGQRPEGGDMQLYERDFYAWTLGILLGPLLK